MDNTKADRVAEQITYDAEWHGDLSGAKVGFGEGAAKPRLMALG